MVIRQKSCCTVLQNVVNIAACTRFQSYIYIYIYTHSVHCTIVIADCGPVTLMGKRGVVHFFSLRRQLRFCSVLFLSYVVGEKKCFCASGSKLSCCRNSFFRTYTHPMWVWKKKVQSLLFDFSLCWYNGGELWKIKIKNLSTNAKTTCPVSLCSGESLQLPDSTIQFVCFHSLLREVSAVRGSTNL